MWPRRQRSPVNGSRQLNGFASGSSGLMCDVTGPGIVKESGQESIQCCQISPWSLLWAFNSVASLINRLKGNFGGWRILENLRAVSIQNRYRSITFNWLEIRVWDAEWNAIAIFVDQSSSPPPPHPPTPHPEDGRLFTAGGHVDHGRPEASWRHGVSAHVYRNWPRGRWRHENRELCFRCQSAAVCGVRHPWLASRRIPHPLAD